MMCESYLYATPISIISNLHTNLWARLLFLWQNYQTSTYTFFLHAFSEPLIHIKFMMVLDVILISKFRVDTFHW